MPESSDQIYALPLSHVGDFTFDQRVVDVFPDMISRSVPGYASILAMIGELAAEYVTEDSNVYDLGCSLGAATRIVRARVPPSCQIHAIDSSPAMVTRLRELLGTEKSGEPSVTVHESDLTTFPIHDSSFSILNFTLQFVPAPQRADVLRAICDGTRPSGALVLSEKVCFEDPVEQRRLSDLHHAFKRANGYSDLEIAQKRTALEKTLVPETIDVHRDRLTKVGFPA